MGGRAQKLYYTEYFNHLGGPAVAVLGKNIWGPGPSSFGRQPRLSEITIEPISGVLPKIQVGIR